MVAGSGAGGPSRLRRLITPSDRPPIEGPAAEAALKALEEALEGVEGWLYLAEAWELHELARRCPHPPAVVEIGAFKGRSTTAILLGVGRRPDGGRVLSVDPFDMVPGQLESWSATVARLGTDSPVEPCVMTSHQARHRVEEETVDVVFVDGSHEEPDVAQDISDWGPALRPGGVMAFNDPSWPGVAAALRDHVAVRHSSFRAPWLVLNTLFVRWCPGRRWTWRDDLWWLRLRLFLAVAPRWLPRNRRLMELDVPDWVKHLELRVALLAFKGLLYRPPSRLDWD